MKHFLYLLLAFSLLSCKIAAPTFKNLGQWEVSKLIGSQVTLSNTAFFYNPNSLDGLKLNGVQLSVQADGRNIGLVKVSQSGTLIPKRSDFQVPVNLIVNLTDLVGNLSSILDIVSGKTIQIRCVGDIQVGYINFNKTVKVDQTIPLNLKDIK